jgi:hypothetical protein
LHYRELGRSKWPSFHDHPREQWVVYNHPIDDPEARAEALRELRKETRAAAKAAKQRELELDITDFAEAKQKRDFLVEEIDRSFALIARVAKEQKQAALLEWDEIERIEAEELDRLGGRIVRCGDRGDQFAYEIPAQSYHVDHDEFLRAEREQLKVDRRNGTLVKLGEP